MTTVFFAVEDVISSIVADRLLRKAFGASCVSKRLLIRQQGGNGQLRTNIPKYKNLCTKNPVAVITDLDNSKCAVSLVRGWFGAAGVPKGLSFRVAVREIEAWLMADREGIAEFLGVSESVIPARTDDVQNPKQTLVAISRKARRELRSEIVPSDGSNAIRGLGYNDVFSAFARETWDAERASGHSESLRRAIAGFQKLRDHWAGRRVR